MTAPAHIYEIFIRARPETVWAALTDPEYTRRYFHRTRFESTFEPGARFLNVLDDGAEAVDGVVEVFDPPHRLVMTWHVLYDTEMANEPPGRVEWRLSPANDDGSVTRLTLRHGDLAASPLTWAHVRVGWVEIIDSLKTLLETGVPLPGVDTSSSGDSADANGQWHRAQGIAASNAVWGLLETADEATDGGDALLGAAHASAYHWARAEGSGAANLARASWMLSRCYVVLGYGELALHHAERCAAVVSASGLDDFDLAYAHEARARALACLGRVTEAGAEHRAASSVSIADPDDRVIFIGDLDAAPWFGLDDSSEPTEPER